MLTLLILLPIAILGFAIGGDDDDDSSPAEPTPETDERLNGTSGNDQIETGEGDDLVRGAAGDDVVVTSEGDDTVFGQDGEDIIFGQAGDDFLRGGADLDIFVPGSGEDTVIGDGGSDLIFGADLIEDSVGDLVFTDLNAAVAQLSVLSIAAETGEADTLSGGAENDLIFFGNNDDVTGGGGDDTFTLGDWVNTSAGQAVVQDFDPADDVLVYSYDGDEGAEPVVTFTENGGTAFLSVNGVETVALTGVTFSDLTADNLTIVNRA